MKVPNLDRGSQGPTGHRLSIAWSLRDMAGAADDQPVMGVIPPETT